MPPSTLPAKAWHMQPAPFDTRNPPHHFSLRFWNKITGDAHTPKITQLLDEKHL